MEKVLTQSEIDALFRAAQGPPEGPGHLSSGLSVEPWDLRHSSLLGKEQLHSLNQLYEGFARNLTSAVGVHLGDKFEVALVAVEQITYRDFLARPPEVTYYATFRLPPGDGRAVLHLELGLAFPVVDLLLGGSGAMPTATREVTAIEEAVLEGVGRLICQELQQILLPLGLEVEFEQRQPAMQMLRIMPPEEKTLTLTFDVGMSQSKGTMNIVLPSAVSSGLMRKLRAELVYEHAHGPAVHQKAIGQRLLESRVPVHLRTPAIAIRVPELLTLRPGAVLNLRCRVEEPALLTISHRPCWLARPVESRSYRGAQLMGPVETRKEDRTP